MDVAELRGAEVQMFDVSMSLSIAMAPSYALGLVVSS